MFVHTDSTPLGEWASRTTVEETTSSIPPNQLFPPQDACGQEGLGLRRLLRHAKAQPYDLAGRFRRRRETRFTRARRGAVDLDLVGRRLGDLVTWAPY